MRSWIAFALAAVLAACGGEKKDEKPDFTKMDPAQACAVVSKKVFECKEVVKKEMTSALKMQGASDADIAEVAAIVDQPLPCDGMQARELDTMKTCYDNDCKKLAACLVPLVTKSGGDNAPTGTGEPAAPTTAEPAAGSGTATPP